MKAVHTLVSVAAFVIAGSAFAGGGPNPYPPETSASDAPVSRAQVVAELREAQRLGLIPEGEGDVPSATPEQAQMIADAGRRAAEQEKAFAANDGSKTEPAAASEPPAKTATAAPKRRWLL